MINHSRFAKCQGNAHGNKPVRIASPLTKISLNNARSTLEVSYIIYMMMLKSGPVATTDVHVHDQQEHQQYDDDDVDYDDDS